MPQPRLHPFFRLLICVAGCGAIQFLVVGLVSMVVAVASTVQGQAATDATLRFMSANLLLLTLLIYPPTLLWLWFCRRYFDRRAFVALGLRGHGFFGQVLMGWICGALAIGLVFGVLILTGHARIVGFSLEAQRGGLEMALLALLGWMFVMLAVGFFEEVAFRGYAYHNLHAWTGARWANAIQAAVFAFVHLGNLASAIAPGASTPAARDQALLAAVPAMPNILLIAIFFTLCYHKTGSLWFPIAFHAAWNFFLGCVFSLPVSGLPIWKLFDVEISGNTLLTGGSFGPEASLLLTPILLTLCFVISRASDHPQAVFDLESLKNGAPLEYETREELPTDDESRENRFKTRMRSRTAELDPDTMATLRALNDQSKDSNPTSSAGSTLVSPELKAPVALSETSFAPSIVAPINENPQPVQPVATPQPSTPAPPREEPSAPPPSSTPSPPNSSPPSAPPKKSAPRW